MIHPVYEKYKLWNICNLGDLVDHDSEKFCTMNFSWNFPVVPQPSL